MESHAWTMNPHNRALLGHLDEQRPDAVRARLLNARVRMFEIRGRVFKVGVILLKVR